MPDTGYSRPDTEDRVKFSLLFSILYSTLIFGWLFAQEGFLTVKTRPTGMEIFLDGKEIGRSTIEMMRLKPGNYTVALFPSDSLEDAYWRARERGIVEIIRRIPDFARYHAASVRVTIIENQETEVFLSYDDVLKAKRNALFALWGGSSCLFLTGAILGVILCSLFH